MLPLLFEGLIQRVHSLKTSPSSQAPWQAMPVLIDRKIAADDGLPLTENQLTLSQTAIFVGVLEAVERVLEKHVAPSSNSDSGKTCDDWHGTLGAANAPGWLLGSILLHPLMQRLSMKQLLVLLGATMLLLSVGTITLPYIQVVSLTMLCSVRLVHGMCLNIQGLQLNRPKSWEFPQRKGLCSFWDSFWVGNFAGPTLPSPFLWWPRQYVYMQNCFPGYGSQLCSLVNALYSVVAVLMAILCGSLTLHTDWRLEAFVWFGLPILLGPDLAEKNMENTSGWHGTSWKHRINPPQNVQLFFFCKDQQRGKVSSQPESGIHRNPVSSWLWKLSPTSRPPGLFVAFPDLWSVLASLPRAFTTTASARSDADPTDLDKAHHAALPPELRKDLVNLAICFWATVPLASEK